MQHYVDRAPTWPVELDCLRRAHRSSWACLQDDPGAAPLVVVATRTSMWGSCLPGDSNSIAACCPAGAGIDHVDTGQGSRKTKCPRNAVVWHRLRLSKSPRTMVAKLYGCWKLRCTSTTRDVSMGTGRGVRRMAPTRRSLDDIQARACRHLGASGARRFSIRRGQPLWS